MKVFEIIILIIFSVGISLKLLNFPGSSVLIVFSLLPLSLYYFLFGFAIFNNIKIKNIFKSSRYKTNSSLMFIFAILLGLSLSFLIFGIMYKLQNWFIQLDILLIGIIVTVIILSLYYFLLNNKIRKYRTIYLRSLVIISIGVIVYFVF